MGADADVNVKVAVRLRPLNAREKENNSEICVECNGQTCSIRDPKSKKDTPFTFDHSYGAETANSVIYEDLGAPILSKALEGYNGTIFAYGQTGSGKTFNMMGVPDEKGLIPRLNVKLFDEVKAREADMEFLVSVSYIEIYQEVLGDLLNPSDRQLVIRQHPSTGIYVEGVAEIVVRSEEEINRLMEQGNKVRAVGQTNMNATSSRSHSVFTIKVAQRARTEDDNSGVHAKINLVDLAGSERASSTGATGDRLKEGAAINKSLSTLGNVINALADSKKKGTHIPYRDSKLTRLLQESLGGNAITVMLAALSPADINFDETLSTLNYANRAKNIINKSSKNEDENTKVIRELREEIKHLQKMLSMSAEGGIDLEQMKKMEQMMSDLEHAKNQSWDARAKVSKTFEEERVNNLQERGMIEVVMENLRTDNEELKSALAAMEAEKERLIKNFKGQKVRVAKLKESVEDAIQQYSLLVNEGRTEEQDTKDLLEKIHRTKRILKEESDKLKDIKQQLKDNAETEAKKKDELRAQHFILAEDSEVRKAIQDDEREKIARENEEFLKEERKRLWDDMEKEKERIRSETEAKYASTSQVNVQDYLDLEMKLIQEKSDKELLMTKVGILTQEHETLSNALEEDHLSSQLELEKQQIQHFKVFRQYRYAFEVERRKMEQKYMAVLDEVVKDAVYLSNEKAKLEEELAELRQLHK